MKQQFTFLLTTTDKYEFAVSQCDTLTQMSKETGIPFNLLWNSYSKNQTCCSGKYKVHKVDITDYEDMFTFENYKQFCLRHNLKQTCFNNLVKFKKLCNILDKFSF